MKNYTKSGFMCNKFWSSIFSYRCSSLLHCFWSKRHLLNSRLFYSILFYSILKLDFAQYTYIRAYCTYIQCSNTCTSPYKEIIVAQSRLSNPFNPLYSDSLHHWHMYTVSYSMKCSWEFPSIPLKVHKNENFGFDFEFCTISLLVMSNY